MEEPNRTASERPSRGTGPPLIGPIRALIVGDSRSRHIERLAQALAERQIHAAVAGFDENELELPLYRLNRLPPNQDRRYALAVPALMRVIRRLRPRVVHAHYLSSYGVLAAAASRALDVMGLRSHALVLSAWGTDVLVTPTASRGMAALTRFALRSANVVTGDSAELHTAASTLAGRPLRWHEFIFGPPATLADMPRSPTEVIYVSARSLTREMRVGRVIEAFLMARDLDRRLSSARLAVCGSGSAERELREAYRDAAGIEFMGQLATEELHRLLLRSTAFISIPESDGTSASLLEGMAAGSIPIVNGLRANLEWVQPATGIVVSEDPTPAELAEAMVRASGAAFSLEPIRRAVGRAEWETQVDSLLELYDELVAPS